MDGLGSIEGCTLEELAEARDRKRDSLFMSAQVTFATTPGVHEVRVRNLSEGGLMVEFDRPVEPGGPVRLAMRGLGELTGTVAWCTRGRVGIALDVPIDPKRARKSISGGGSTPAYAKPILVTRGTRR